jgi:hypothetical protein
MAVPPIPASGKSAGYVAFLSIPRTCSPDVHLAVPTGWPIHFAATSQKLIGRYDRIAEGGLPALWGVDVVTRFLSRIVAWIVAGYPEGVPGPDRVPLLALLRRRLTDDEVKSVVADLQGRAELPATPDIDIIDIGVLITQITDDLPSRDDIERVRLRLAAQGWPLDDPRDESGDEQ